MARGEDTRNHPNRGVSRGAYAQLARELSKGFPQMDDETDRLVNTRVVGVRPDYDVRPDMGYLQNRAQDSDNAPAGGIKRPEMESCTNCGTETPKGSGSCVDCK